MTYKLIIKPLAELDTMEAAKWYNDHRDGLGNEFLLALEAKIHAIKRNPNQFSNKYKKVHRALTERFPYGIFYFIENKTIFIIAIVHTHRSPGVWKKRK